LLELKTVTKRYGDHTAADTVSLAVDQGQFISLLGPSGSGKSTVLRMIAGLIEPDAGSISIGGDLVYDGVRNVPPEKRRIGMVFQDYALWPHMTVAKNIAFGLRLRRWPRSHVRSRVDEMLDLVRLAGLRDRYPWQLSGGQQQRVALARALASDPRLLLLDEPLSSLDTQLRETLRGELAALLHRIGVTSVYVTHDQSEALEMSDVIAILRDGRVEQVGRPTELYEKPSSLFVGRFLGAMNVLRCTTRVQDGSLGAVIGDRWFGLTEGADERGGILCIRPEAVEVVTEAQNGTPNVAPATLLHSGFLGGRWQHVCAMSDYQQLQVFSAQTLNLGPGSSILLRLPREHCRLMAKESDDELLPVAAPAVADPASRGGV
jgi:ABC-type Fe3+/spermidine/putrescine transport system ATPase subunit